MGQFRQSVKKFVQAEEGATMVEYGLLVGLLSVAAIASIVAVGKFVNGAFDKVQTDMAGAGIPGGG
jgi:pilus assembly protein Flp/PilA